MSNVMLISVICLWGLVLLLLLSVGVLARQVGLLHRRIGPVGARMMNDGPPLNEKIAVMTVGDIAGRQIAIGGPNLRHRLLVFLSATCSSCEDLVPALRSIAKSDSATVEVIVIGLNGDERVNREFVKDHKLEHLTYIISADVGMTFKVMHPPYAVVLDREGVVRAKGLANHLEHLESLLNATELGEPSIESYMQQTMTELAAENVGSR